MAGCGTRVQQAAIGQQGLAPAVIPWMTCTIVIPSVSSFAGPTGRFRLALAASAFFHLLFAAGLVSETPRATVLPAAATPITARLEPSRATLSADPVLSEPETPPAAPRVKQSAPIADRERQMAADADARSTRDTLPLALPQTPDPTFYAVRDLDSFPRPVAPLDLDWLVAGDAAPGRVRFALLIDEHGIVNDIAAVESGAPGAVVDRLRALLAAARFVPGYKDGRAVKSRVVLSINFEISDR